jgi:hypothetical protein
MCARSPPFSSNSLLSLSLLRYDAKAAAAAAAAAAQASAEALPVKGDTDDLMNDLDDSDDEDAAPEPAAVAALPPATAQAESVWEKSDAINFALYC